MCKPHIFRTAPPPITGDGILRMRCRRTQADPNFLAALSIPMHRAGRRSQVGMLESSTKLVLGSITYRDTYPIQVPPVLRNFCGYIADQSYHRIYISRSDISQYINESKATSAWGHSLGVFSYSLVFVLSFGWTGHIFSSLCESIWLRLGLAQSGEDN